MTPTVRDLVVITLVSGAPVCLTLIVAILRGYRIDVHMERPHRRGNDDAR